MTLAEETARRLEAAGITPGDPGLARIRTWNALVYERARVTGRRLHDVGTRGQYGRGLTHQPGTGK